MIPKLIVILSIIFTASIFPQIESQEFLNGASVMSIKEEGNDIWVATYGQGIFKYDKKNEKWSNFSTKQNNLSNDFFYSLAVSKNYVWAGSVEGLFIYDKRGNRWSKRKFYLGGQMGNWIRSLCYDKDKNILWIGRFMNLTRLDVAKRRYSDFDMTQNSDAKTNNFVSIKLDGDSLIWFGTEAGVFKYDKSKNIEDKSSYIFINNKNGGFKEDGNAVSIADMIFERNNIWFGTDEFITPQQPDFNVGGIYEYNRKLSWDRISRTDGLPSNGIFCLEITGNKIWASVYAFDKNQKKEYGKGIVLIDRITKEITPVDLNKTSISTSTIYSLYFDGENMWVGTLEGLWKIKLSNPFAKWTMKKPSSKKTKR